MKITDCQSLNAGFEIATNNGPVGDNRDIKLVHKLFSAKFRVNSLYFFFYLRISHFETIFPHF